MTRLDYLNPSNLHYILALYEQYKKDPDNVEASWRNFFEGFELALSINYGESTPTTEYEDSEVVEQIKNGWTYSSRYRQNFSSRKRNRTGNYNIKRNTTISNRYLLRNNRSRIHIYKNT